MLPSSLCNASSFKDGSFGAAALLEILEHLLNVAINKGIVKLIEY
jgi:hypothetical protein